MKRLKLILSIAGMLISVALIGFVAYSWYVNIDVSSDMRFEILQIQSLVSMYEGKDMNHNGIPDKLATANVGKYYNRSVGNSGSYISYENKYYNETFDFEYLDQRYALARDSESNLLNTIVIEDLVPSKVYTYKFEITNLSRKGNYVSFGFENDTDADLETLKDFKARCGVIDSAGDITFTSWCDFVDGNSYSAFTITDSSLTVPGFTASLEVGRLDVWLEIKQDSESNLVLDSYRLPEFRLTLSIDDTLA